MLDLRLCSHQDIPRILYLAQNFQHASDYNFPFDSQHVQVLVSECLSNSNMLVLGLFHEDLLIGLLAAAVVQHPFFNIPFSSDLMWWIEPEYRGSRKSIEMLKAYEYWAVNKQGAQLVSLVSLADERVDKMYSRLGYKKQEHTWSKSFASNL